MVSKTVGIFLESPEPPLVLQMLLLPLPLPPPLLERADFQITY